MEKLNISEVIGEGHYPDEERVVAFWNTDGKADTPIRIQHGTIRGQLKANTLTVMPACVAQMLVESGYDVDIPYLALVNEGADEVLDEALEASRTKAAELVKLKVDDLKDALAGLDINTLRFMLEAEEAEGPGKTRKTALEVIGEAIDAHPDQIAALAAAAQQPPENKEPAS